MFEVFCQICLARAQCSKHIAFGGFIHHDVGHDAFGLDGIALGRVVTRRRELEARIWAKGANHLHRAFAKGLAAHDFGAAVVL